MRITDPRPALALSLAFLFSLGLSACQGQKKASTQATPTPNPSSLLTQAKLFENIDASETPYRLYRLLSGDPKNVNLSPLSLDMAFAQVYLGATGKSKDLMGQIFGFKDGKFSFESEFKLMRELEPTDASAKKETPKLYLANSVWVRASSLKNVSSSYKQLLSRDLDGTVHPLSLKGLNQWVSQATHEKIRKLVDQIDPSDVAYFVNAIYLKADWTSPFQAQSTTREPFRSAHSVVKTEMMHQNAKFNYYEDENSKWLAMEYKGLPLEMVLGLPKKDFDLDSVEKDWSAASMKKVFEGMSQSTVKVTLPKFKFNTKLSLKRVFDEAGYNRMFQPGDFSNFVSPQKNFRISDVIQATAIQVDEKGTEAAAATAAVMRESAVFSLDPKTFKADQPFLFLIRNTKSGEIYFMGRVSNPKE